MIGTAWTLYYEKTSLRLQTNVTRPQISTNSYYCRQNNGSHCLGLPTDFSNLGIRFPTLIQTMTNSYTTPQPLSCWLYFKYLQALKFLDNLKQAADSRRRLWRRPRWWTPEISMKWAAMANYDDCSLLTDNGYFMKSEILMTYFSQVTIVASHLCERNPPSKPVWTVACLWGEKKPQTISSFD